MDARIGKMEVSLSARGIATYRLELWHDGLKKHRVIKGKEQSIIQRKAILQVEDWNAKWVIAQQRATKQKERQGVKAHREEQQETATNRSAEAAAALSSLNRLLGDTLEVDDAIDWSTLLDQSDFPTPKPVPVPPPGSPAPASAPTKPEPDDEEYRPQLGLLDKLVGSRRGRKNSEAAERYKSALAAWSEAVESAKVETNRREQEYKEKIDKTDREFSAATKKWEQQRKQFLEEQRQSNETVNQRRALYEAKDSEAILDYCDMVLSNSRYPDWMPEEWDLDYNPETRILVVEYALPSMESLPTLSEVKYVQTRDEFTEKHLSDAQKRKLYDSVIYQITLRTIHEMFESDLVDALEAVVFNGRVTSTDRSTGHETTACILSVHAKRDEFANVNLANVDPKACFKSLKGVGSSKLHSMTPVAPILEMRREDGRFVSAREVVNTLDDSVNLAAMDWEDFEHLIREIFEQEFASGGGEVKVTQASRDGGVDAIAFDPDPIRGGKLVIQAKRYTNTVGVAAVRDLYGTLVNEGASKGILVTTSDYGPDAYSFARGKPISLLNGANLLHLLEKHGKKAKIDIPEARRLME